MAIRSHSGFRQAPSKQLRDGFARLIFQRIGDLGGSADGRAVLLLVQPMPIVLINLGERITHTCRACLIVRSDHLPTFSPSATESESPMRGPAIASQIEVHKRHAAKLARTTMVSSKPY
jgi:hypothetical protein